MTHALMRDDTTSCVACVAVEDPACWSMERIIAADHCTRVACDAASPCWPACRPAGACDRTPVPALPLATALPR